MLSTKCLSPRRENLHALKLAHYETTTRAWPTKSDRCLRDVNRHHRNISGHARLGEQKASHARDDRLVMHRSTIDAAQNIDERMATSGIDLLLHARMVFDGQRIDRFAASRAPWAASIAAENHFAPCIHGHRRRRVNRLAQRIEILIIRRMASCRIERRRRCDPSCRPRLAYHWSLGVYGMPHYSFRRLHVSTRRRRCRMMHCRKGDLVLEAGFPVGDFTSEMLASA